LIWFLGAFQVNYQILTNARTLVHQHNSKTFRSAARIPTPILKKQFTGIMKAQPVSGE
jgi:hypothetical protein